MHLKKITKSVLKLSKGRNNNVSINILSLLAIESYFRPIDKRVAEYLYWILTGNNSVTIGIAQIKVSINYLLATRSIFCRMKSIIKLESFQYNYYLVESLLDNSAINNKEDAEVCKYYNGINVDTTYIDYFKFAKQYIYSILNTNTLK